VKYLASTYVPWLLLLLLIGVVGHSSFRAREVWKAELASCEEQIAKTPESPAARADPWIQIGGGSAFADIPHDRLKLIHATAILPDATGSCLLRSTSMLVEVDDKGAMLRQGSSNIAIQRVDDCTFLLKTYGPQ